MNRMLKFIYIFAARMLPTVNISKLLKRKLATAVLITASVASFATLGDGGRKKTTSSKSLFTHSYNHNFKTFSLKSGYNYRGNTFFNTPAEEKFIMLNTVVTYQKGNATYILPMKKKVLLDKIKFRPTP
jgi:hypothetical protein